MYTVAGANELKKNDRPLVTLKDFERNIWFSSFKKKKKMNNLFVN